MEAMKASRCTTRREYSFWMKCTPRKPVYDERIFIINFYRMNHRMKRIEILIYRNGFDANARGALDRRQQSHSMNLFLLPWFKPFLFKLRAIISYWYWFLNRYHLVMCFCFQLKRRLLGMEMDAYGYMCEREREKESERSNERMCVCVCVFFVLLRARRSINRWVWTSNNKKNANAYIIKACWQMNFLAYE